MSEIKITKARLLELERAAAKLNALEAGGVDNWEWYDEALKDYRQTIELEEKYEDLLNDIAECLCEGIDQPAGSGCGFEFSSKVLDNALVIIKQSGLKFEVKP